MMRYLILPLLVLASCNMPECKNTNPVFDNNAPNTPAYNAELVKQLKANKTSLRYWVDAYRVVNADTYVTLFVQGKDLCARLWLDVGNPGDGTLEHLKEKQAVSYSGAELAELQYRTVPEGDNYRFVYQSADRIID